MLRKETYLTAALAAMGLSQKGISVSAGASTILGELLDLSSSTQTLQTSTTLPTIITSNASPGSYYEAGAEQRAIEVEMTTKNFEETSQHSLKISALADDLAPLVTSHISFARNVVAPLVVDLGDKMVKFIETQRPLDPSTSFEIRECAIPAILLDESFMNGGLQAYESVDASYADTTLALDVPTDDASFQAMINTGNDRQNELIAQWLTGLGLDYIKLVYIRAFSNQPWSEYRPNIRLSDEICGSWLGNPGECNNPYDTLNQALATYLIASYLFTNVQSVKDISLTDYKTQLRDVIDYAGSMVHKALRTAARQISGNVLVSEANMMKRRIVLNKPVYDDWLTKGGKPEVVLGMLVSGNIQYAVPAVDEAKDALIRQWENYVVLSQTTLRNEFRARFRQYVEAEFASGLNLVTEGLESEYVTGKSGIKDQQVALAQKALDDLGNCAMDDLNTTALILIAKCRFFYSSAYVILSQMAEVAKATPNVDPREAALLAAISYLSDYFVAQMQASK